MANDVKWIKMMVGMFDGMSFKKIKRARIGGESYRDKLTAVWFELMDFAGKCNHDGAFISPSEIPFTELSDIATMIDRDEEELELCLAFFINEGMVTVIDDVYSLSNWTKYQNREGLEAIREQNRLRQQQFRDRKKQKLIGDDNVCVYCGNPGDTIDHVIAKANGGLDIPENTVCCCLSCNTSKNNRDVSAFLNDRLLLGEKVDRQRIAENPVLKRFLRFDYKSNRYITLRVTLHNDTDKESELRVKKENTTPISPSKGTVVSWQVHCKDNKAGNVAVNDNLAESSVISDDLVDYINDELKKPDLMQERFEQFWKLYPKKVGKGDARKKFLKLKPNQKLFDQILSAVEAAKKTEQWTKNNGQFVPNPATWLNQSRWEDDYSGSMATNSANLDYGEENEYMPF